MKTLNNEQLKIVISLLDEQIRAFNQRVNNQQETYDDCKSSLDRSIRLNNDPKFKNMYSQESIQEMTDSAASALEFLSSEKAELNKYQTLRSEL